MFRFLSAVAAVALSFQPLHAGQLSQVILPPIAHAQATLVVVGANGQEQAYSPADLEGFPTFRLTTATPWRDEPAEFDGVLLREVLAANGLDQVDAIVVTAENDYRTVIEREVFETMDILVATRVDGRAHSRRLRGPIQFVIDKEAFEASDKTSESNLVWMAARIEPHR